MAFGTLMHRYPGRAFPHDFDRLVVDLLNGFGRRPFEGARSEKSNEGGRYSPRLEAVDDEKEYRITVEIPGVDASDTDVSIVDGVLTLKGQRKLGDEVFHFEERIRFPGEIDEGGVQASHKNGVLTVVVPKQLPAKPEVRSIPVQTA